MEKRRTIEGIELPFANLIRSFWRTSVATLYLTQKNWIPWRYFESRCLIKSDFKDTFHCKCISSGPVAKVSWLVKCCQSLESFTVRNLLLLFSENIFQPKIKICISQFAWSCSIGGWLWFWRWYWQAMQNVCAFPWWKQRAGKRNVILALHYLPLIELTVFKLRRQGQGEWWRGLPLKMRNRLLQEPRAWSASFAIFFFCRVKFKLLHIQDVPKKCTNRRKS